MSVFSRRQRPRRPVRRALAAAAPELAANDAPTQAVPQPGLGKLATGWQDLPHAYMTGRVPFACRCGAPESAPVHHAQPKRRPSFTPALALTSADITFPPPARDFPVFLPPVIGDSLDPRPSWEEPPEPEPGTSPVLYARRGWTKVLTAVRKRNGELDELDTLVEQGHGRNAAEYHTSLRHNRERTAEGAWQLCAELGCPDMFGALLNRVGQYAAAAQARRAA